MTTSGSDHLFTYEHYRYIIRSAQESGYGFIGFPELKNYRQNAGRICILRHDCDHDLPAAAKLARIEEEMGVRSTYFLMLRCDMYNLMSPLHANLVREIIQRGHLIGLHFDEWIYPDATAAKIRDEVDRERGWLSREFGMPIDVVSFHQPSRRVLQNEVKLSCISTYDKEDMKDVYYMSDSKMVLREGCPGEILKARKHQRLQLLLHPELWTEEEMPLEEKWRGMLRNTFELMQEGILSREGAYLKRQEISFG